MKNSRDKIARVLLALALVLLPVLPTAIVAAEPAPQTVGRSNFVGSATVSALNQVAASGAVNITCGNATCQAGVYRLDFEAEVIHPNVTQTSPNLSATFGWTGDSGALTAAVTNPSGQTTASTATTGTTFHGSRLVKTTGVLTINFGLSGTGGGQVVNWEAAATRLR